MSIGFFRILEIYWHEDNYLLKNIYLLVKLGKSKWGLWLTYFPIKGTSVQAHVCIGKKFKTKKSARQFVEFIENNIIPIIEDKIKELINPTLDVFLITKIVEEQLDGLADNKNTAINDMME